MITQLRFQNFKALKNAELKLGAFNVIIGPNGSGKSSVLQGLELFADPVAIHPSHQAVTVGMGSNSVSIAVDLNLGNRHETARFGINNGSPSVLSVKNNQLLSFAGVEGQEVVAFLRGIRTFSFEASSLWQPVDSRNWMALNRDGKNLAGAITHLRDKDEDAYNRLREEFMRWIPEYDSIGFENDQNGYRNLNLRQKATRRSIPASQASEATLLTLALLTIGGPGH